MCLSFLPAKQISMAFQDFQELTPTTISGTSWPYGMRPQLDQWKYVETNKLNI